MPKLFEHFEPNWQQILDSNSLGTFSAIWNLKSDWFEEPNFRRGGWSGVVKYPLSRANGSIDIFIKRQENHVSKTFLHPIRGIATFQKEFHNINRLTHKNVSTLELIYFGKKDNQAILVTKSLDGYDSLDSTKFVDLEYKNKLALIRKIASATAKMHVNHFQHNCFYPKHIFVKKINGQWDVRFIDLEKLKRTIFKKQAVIRDLFSLHRHAGENWTIKDRIYFLKAYANEKKLSPSSKKLWSRIEKKLKTKYK
ncbi:MAG: inaA protein [Piscirickettsiaceae bacterium]|nr:inaA protein [Piscirickettsiaceae bacterium]